MIRICHMNLVSQDFSLTFQRKIYCTIIIHFLLFLLLFKSFRRTLSYVFVLF
jgi:hypothetical protein